MNSTAYAKRTLYKPIDFFFRGVADSSTKNKMMVFVEVQTGDNLDENDIVRFEDKYGRIS